MLKNANVSVNWTDDLNTLVEKFNKHSGAMVSYYN